jgi:hypothetical protein
MNRKIGGVLLSATCAGVLALTLTAAAAATSATSTAPSQTKTNAPLSTTYALYRNTQWHFALEAPSNVVAEATDIPGGVTVQFTTPDGDELFMVSAWRYQDLVVHADGLRLLPPSTDADQGDELDTVHYYDSDIFQIAFQKNGTGYVVQTVARNATSTLDSLKSWHFI